MIYKSRKVGQIIVTCVRETLIINPTIRTPEDSYNFWLTHIEKDPLWEHDKEYFMVLCLSKKYNLKAWNKVSTGILDTSLVHPREVFRPAIVEAASAIILMHNHPSGDASPSAEDLRITRQLVDAGKILDIEVLDHVIAGITTPEHKGFVSIRESGLVKFCE